MSFPGFGGYPPLSSFGRPASNIPVTSYPVTSSSVEVQPITSTCGPCAAPFLTTPPPPPPICAPCAPVYAPPRPVCAPLSLPPPPPAPLPLPQPVDVHIVDDRAPRCDALEEELRSVRHQLTISEDNEQRLKRQLQETQSKLKVWMQKEGNLGSLFEENARLKERIFEGDLRLVNSEGQRAGMAEQIARLERDLGVANGRLGEAQQLEVELGELQRQLHEARNRNAGLEEDHQRFQSTISTLEAQLSEANDRLFQARNSFEAERANLQQQLQELFGQLQFTEGQRDDAVKQCQFFELKLREADERIFALEKGSNQAKAQLQSEIAGLREQLAASQQRIGDLDRARLDATNKVSVLEAKLREADSRLGAADQRIQSLQARIAALEAEIANLRARLTAKPELHSTTNVKETYKVKSFEIAAKLAVMDGTDDGMYNGLPIEVEGEGLYRELVAKGRRPKGDVTAFRSLTSSSTETYKVNSYEMADRLSKMDGTDDGKYNGLPIEVVGQGLFTDLRRGGGFSTATISSVGSGSGISTSAGGGSVGVKGGETYIVTSVDIAATLSKMSGKDDGTYKGLPIEVKGMGLYRDLRARR
eukprot:EG_transcript_5502